MTNIKFRAFKDGVFLFSENYGLISFFSQLMEFDIIQQFTGLKDKNVDRGSCIYEGDILSLDGIIIDNIHENKEMAEGRTNLVIEGFGTRIWRVTEEKAMDRGCSYSK